MTEVWKSIEGYEGIYEVSNFGRVKSLERYVIRGRGGKQPVNERIRGLTDDKDGYKFLRLHKDKRSRNMRVHRLVAQAFIPNPEGKAEVNHINGVPYDNRAENLEWVTPSENQKHAFAIGLQKRTKGTEHNMVKLSEEDVFEIRKLYHECGLSQTDIGKKFQIGQPTVYKIVNNLLWKHI